MRRRQDGQVTARGYTPDVGPAPVRIDGTGPPIGW